MAVTFILKYLKDFSGNIGNGWMRLNFTYDDILEAVKSFSQRFMIAMEELPDRAKDIRTSVKQSIIDYMRKDSTDDNEESEETEASHDEQLDSPKADVYLPPKKRRNRDQRRSFIEKLSRDSTKYVSPISREENKKMS